MAFALSENCEKSQNTRRAWWHEGEIRFDRWGLAPYSGVSGWLPHPKLTHSSGLRISADRPDACGNPGFEIAG